MTDVATPMGTPAYMSPEQSKGLPTDRRTDIWSLGVMMYEMATGQLPFNGPEPVAVFHAIQHSEPEPITALRTGLPIEVDRIVAKCLAKDPSERYQHVDDVIVDIAALRKSFDSGATGAAAHETAGAGRRSPRSVRNAVLVTAAIGAAVAITWSVASLLRQSEAPALERTVKFTFTPDRLVRGSDRDIDAEVSVSPDGKHITYVEGQGGQLWIRDIDKEQPRPVPGATRVYQAFWSPDNTFIAYAVGRELKKIPSVGGVATTITTLAGDFRGGTWSADGETVVYCDTTGLYTVAAAGGPPTRIVEHPHVEQPSFMYLPHGRRAFLYQVLDRPPKHEIQYQIVGEDQRHTIVASDSTNPYPVYSPTGHILYVDGLGESVAIWALPFSLANLAAAGKAFPVASGSSPKVSQTGRDLLYREKKHDGTLGNEMAFLRTRFEEAAPAFSPDGKFIAYVSNESGQAEVYVRGFPDGAGKWRVSTNGGTAPRWPRDAKELFYTEQRQIMAVAATTHPTFSPGTPAPLFANRTLNAFNPQYDVSADGKRFILTDRIMDEKPLAIHVVHNWFEEFRHRK